MQNDTPTRSAPPEYRGRRAAAPGLVLSALLCACAAVGPDYEPPDDELPAGWQAAHEPAAAADSVAEDWWQRYDDPVLDQLVTEALRENLDIATARASLAEARAQRAQTASQLGPSLDASMSGSSAEVHDGDGGSVSSDFYAAGFDASWEADVFGGTRRGLEAAEADVQAGEADLRDVQVSLVAEVAASYIELRTAEHRLQVALASLETQQNTYQLTQWRYQAGLASEVEEAQALTSLERTYAGLPQLEATAVAARNRLAVLLNRHPGTLDALLADGAASIPRMQAEAAVGIPAETLSQRPDVRATERRLAAQTARLGQAEAVRYPSFRLSGSIGLEALTLSALDFGGTYSHSLFASITAPIFDSGLISSEIDIQDARLEQALIDYRLVVLEALEEVENALTDVAQTQEQSRRLAAASATARLALELAEMRYRAGLIDFLSVLSSQGTLQELEDQLATSQGDLATAYTRLYKALGGGWQSISEQEHSENPS